MASRQKERVEKLFLDCLQWDEEDVLLEENPKMGRCFSKERR